MKPETKAKLLCKWEDVKDFFQVIWDLGVGLAILCAAVVVCILMVLAALLVLVLPVIAIIWIWRMLV